MFARMGINTSLAISNFAQQKNVTFKSNQPNSSRLKLVFDSAHVKCDI